MKKLVEELKKVYEKGKKAKHLCLALPVRDSYYIEPRYRGASNGV